MSKRRRGARRLVLSGHSQRDPFGSFRRGQHSWNLDRVDSLRFGYAVGWAPVSFHHFLPVVALGEIAVVGGTHQAEVLRAVIPSTPKGLAVMELEPVALFATPTLVVAFCDETSDGRRDVTG